MNCIIFKVKKIYKITGGLIVSALLIMLAAFPDVYMSACGEGLDIFIESVFPALFPFFFFSGLLSVFGVDKIIATLSRKPVRALYGVPPVGGYIMALSFISGYPVGAKLVAESYNNGMITLQDAKRIMPFGSTSGPLFIVGVIGYKILGNLHVGLVLWIVHMLGAALNGIVFSFGVDRRRNDSHVTGADILGASRSDGGFNSAMSGAILSVAKVGGCIIVFNMILAFLTQIGATEVFGKIVGCFGVPVALRVPTVASLLEVTKGAYMLGADTDVSEVIPMLSFALGFGGVSVAIQSTSFLSETGISAGYYFVTKISQAILSYALATVACVCLYGAG